MEIEAVGMNASDSDVEQYDFDRKWNNHSVSRIGQDYSGCFKVVRPFGKIEISASGSGDTNGEVKAGAEVNVSTMDDNGGSISVSAGGNIVRDREGNVYAEGKTEFTYEWEF